MPDTPEIIYHDTAGDVRAAWSSLVLGGGYSLYVDASGQLHALRLGVDTGAE